MAGLETIEKPKAEGQQAGQTAKEQDKRPGGTMFDPESIRKFLEQQKKDQQ